MRLAMAIGFSSGVGSGTLENKPVVRFPQLMGEANMLLYEMLIAIGIAVVLVVPAIDGLAARVIMGPEEKALLRLARAAEAQRRLVADWKQALAAPLPARHGTLTTQVVTQDVT